MTSVPPLLYEVGDDGVAVITLNRPERMNALTPEMLDLWVDAIERATHDTAVGAVVVTGAGTRAFCVGADLSGGRLGGTDVHGVDGERPAAAGERNALRYTIHRIPRALRQLDKPYLAAINGAATGAGMDLASMADIRFVGEGARVGMTYVKVGVVPGDGGAYYLPRIVGMQRALHLMWTGALMDAHQCVEWSYALAAHSADRLVDEVRRYAAALAAGPRVAIELIKSMAYRARDSTEVEALSLAQWAMALARTTADAIEGPRAFAEKRTPSFEGR